MAIIAASLKKQLIYKKQVGKGTQATGASGQLLRRVASMLARQKQTYQSQEIRSDQQIVDFRHGIGSVSGQVSGELSNLTYKDFFASLLRNTWAAGATTGAQTNITAAAGPPGTFTRAAGSFITDGFKIGDVVRWAGWTTTGVNNNARNYRITALSATVMTVGPTTSPLNEAVAAKASGDSVTCTVVGKKLIIPSTGHVDDYYTIEHWFSDIAKSEQFVDCQIANAALNLPPTGIAQVQFGIIGLSMVTGTSQSLTSPTAETSDGVMAAVNGILRIGSDDVAVVTGLQINIDGQLQPSQAIVGSNNIQGTFQNPFNISGRLSAYFDDAFGTTLRDLFLNETEASLLLKLDETSAINTDFMTIKLPRIKLGGADKAEANNGLVQDMPFVALKDGTSANQDQTMLAIQDSNVP